MDEAHIALRETTGEEAVGGKGPGLPGIVAVKLEGALRFVGKIGHLRDGLLHVEGHLVLRDAGLESGVAGLFKLHFMKFADVVENFAAVGAVDTKIGRASCRDRV